MKNGIYCREFYGIVWVYNGHFRYGDNINISPINNNELKELIPFDYKKHYHNLTKFEQDLFHKIVIKILKEESTLAMEIL